MGSKIIETTGRFVISCVLINILIDLNYNHNLIVIIGMVIGLWAFEKIISYNIGKEKSNG